MSSTTQAKASGDPLKGISIPPKPQILVDLHKVGDNTKKIVDLISQDTGVSATVLKTINSPFFGLAKKITSIQQAVLLLGNQSVINIVNSLILRTSLHKDQDENMSEFWDSSMDAAKAAGAIAGELKVAKRDDAYTLGLFHNCGIPILMQKFKNYIEIVEKSYQNPDGLVQQVEQRELDIDHCVVGHHLCDLWNMDELIGDAVLYHHAGPEFFEQEKNGPLKDLVATLMLAEHLVEIHRIVGHNKEDHGWKRVSKHVKKQLNIVTQDDYNDIRNYVFDVALQK